VPAGLTVTGTTSTSVSLSWTEPSSSDPAASYKVYEGTTVVATPTSTSATITGLSPSTGHTYTVTAVDSDGNQSASSASVAATTGSGLTVTITKTQDWGTGYTAQATITNATGAAVTGWSVQFSLDPSMTIHTFWYATLSTSGNHQTFTNDSWDATIANGSTVSFGFNGDYTTSYIAPTNVTVN
jgi:cellulose 1,4-beta-cellobiosidase